ncbi:MAG: AbrB/MazE/SpoVT family DNA-binding domain-containing protein [Nitrosopumilaceae archaeon]|nr:AbrB/MazE/SpoVT family DNA-binding domain-containing protein [Nitrosopumilaceae archaeon]
MTESTLKTVSVSEKGQIAIPTEIQKLLGIKKGDRLVLTTKDEKLLIQKAANLEKHMEDDFSDLLTHSESTLKKLWLNKEDDIWDKYMQ